MVEYTEDQQKVAKHLLDGPKTIEELRKELDLSANTLNSALKELLKLKVVEREDSKYKLIDYITKKVKGGEKMEEKDIDFRGKYRVKMIIEALSQDKEALQRQCDILENKISKEEKISVIDFEKGEILKQEENYTAFFDIEIETKTFKDVIHMIINYGPSSVELIEPEKLELNLNQSQELLNEISSAVHYYVAFILGLQQELMKVKGSQARAPQEASHEGSSS